MGAVALNWEPHPPILVTFVFSDYQTGRAHLHTVIEETRLQLSKTTAAQKKSNLGQFLTPSGIAKFMAGLFSETSDRHIRLLDPGAGIGSLSSAFLDRCISGDLKSTSVHVTAFEIDDHLHDHLTATLHSYNKSPKIDFKICPIDFVESAVESMRLGEASFTHAILNPPYKKINNGSDHRLLLRKVGIETVNLYSAFVALSIGLVRPGGQVVAIVPRSFCNGPYYKPFREFLLKRAAIRSIHLFGSRSKAFKDDDVLQENVILHLEVGAKQTSIQITTSKDDSFDDLVSLTHPFDRIVYPSDPDKFIHVPTSTNHSTLELADSVQFSLSELGIKISTGPVVDFRLKEHLRAMPELNTVPLLYPGHFRGFQTEWPKPELKKPNAIAKNFETEKWLYPSGYYCVVKRFSVKEEKRRIVASAVSPDMFDKATLIGFENHLNVFHEDRHGLTKALAFGLAIYLNTTAVDEFFRRFNGHTQVNATDLKLIKYPSIKNLNLLGDWAIAKKLDPIQDEIDERFSFLCK